MKYISSKDINLGTCLIVLHGISIMGGFIKWPLFILAGIFMFSYIILDRHRLRCPNCGGFENLDRLNYAKKHVFHCRHCGERINIL
ncbi:hypothetical protein SDC9_55266 [bioreactor metagenome]|uniref:Uncharacterized protein n=1 Tax=bioreactor metagenome TaxID=1076179 RepID=A0A644WYG0_9ZZZZ